MTDTPHSPLPWKFVTDGRSIKMGRIEDVEGEDILFVVCGYDAAAMREDAELIVEAVNSHAQLKERVEELEKALDEFVSYEGKVRACSAETRSVALQMFAGLAHAALSKQENK